MPVTATPQAGASMLKLEPAASESQTRPAACMEKSTLGGLAVGFTCQRSSTSSSMAWPERPSPPPPPPATAIEGEAVRVGVRVGVELSDAPKEGEAEGVTEAVGVMDGVGEGDGFTYVTFGASRRKDSKPFSVWGPKLPVFPTT